VIYTVANTVNIGKPIKAIYDRYGQRIDGPTVRCDTETGEIVQLCVGPDGYVLDSSGKEILEKRIILQGPLRVEFAEA
jgi:hypothetical protein